MVNLGIVSLFLKALDQERYYLDILMETATSVLARRDTTRDERNLARWIIGMTDKSVQNVLRDDPTAMSKYVDAYISATEDVADQFRDHQGELLSNIPGIPTYRGSIDWNWVAYLANAVGTSTLTIRGSDKSTFGKLFEKLILGSLLEVLGFELEPSGEDSLSPGHFVLSSRGERRESDATLLLSLGNAIRFDIGFIGRGNTEISLDKVTRFESESEIAGRSRYTATIIIVDRIGPGSRLPQLAQNMGGNIVQMSGSYWPRVIAQLVNSISRDQDYLATCPDSEVPSLMKERFEAVDLSKFL